MPLVFQNDAEAQAFVDEPNRPPRDVPKRAPRDAPARVYHVKNHLEDVVQYLGQEEPKGLCFGVEIELGWNRDEQRCAFFDELDNLGLQKKLMSKHDGTVAADYNSEIVTGAFDRKEIRDIVGQVGGLIELFSSRGLRTNYCGVHVHLSEAALERDQVWRAHCSLLDQWALHAFWDKAMRAPDDWEANHEMWQEFITAVSLRGPNEKSKRVGHQNIRTFMEYREKHDRAFQRGRQTPTMEYRHMRTARSKRVTLSYIDFAESHMAFCKEAPEKYLDPNPVPSDWENIGWPPKPFATPLRRTMLESFDKNPKTGEFECKRVVRYIDDVTGDILGANQVQKVKARDAIVCYPDEATLTQRGLVIPPTSTHAGARNWMGFQFPLEAYIEYVLERSELYPSLAARLQLDRFAQYVTKHSKTFVFDGTKPHLEFQQGCLVTSENLLGGYTIVSKINPENPPDEVMIKPEGKKAGVRERIQYLVHECPGALEKGGES